MDFNDLNKSLARVYQSVGARFDDDLEKRINIQRSEANGRVEVKMSINDNGEADSTNKILAIIEHLGKLKDHIKNAISKNGGDANVVEDEINQSPHLQVLMDLYNSEKHGYPLTRLERSGKSPKIVNIKNVLQISTQAKKVHLAAFQ